MVRLRPGSSGVAREFSDDPLMRFRPAAAPRGREAITCSSSSTRLSAKALMPSGHDRLVETVRTAGYCFAAV